MKDVSHKIPVVFEIVFVIDKPKAFVRELMLKPHKPDTVTYYQPIYTCNPLDVPDYSDTIDWYIGEKDYTVDLVNPYWHSDWRVLVEALKPFWDQVMDNNENVYTIAE